MSRTASILAAVAAVIGLVAATTPPSAAGAQPPATPKNGFEEFSDGAVRIRLEDFFSDGQPKVLNDELAAQGIVFDNTASGDFSSVCPGQFDLAGGHETGHFSFEPVSFRFVDPDTRERRVTTAVGVPVGSLFNNRGQGPFQVTLTAFDVKGNLLGSVTSDAPPDPSRAGTDFVGIESPAGIHRLVLDNESSPSNAYDTFVVGDFFYSAPQAECSFEPDLVFEALSPPVNDPPLAAGDAFRTDEDKPLTVPAPGVLANDSDPNGDRLTAILVDGPAQGTLDLNPDGSFIYQPVPDANGAITFTYRASDAAADSSPAQVTLTVTPVNDVPVATDDEAAGVMNTSVQVPVVANDADVDGDTLTATPVSAPPHGMATCSGGTCTYAPAVGFTGGDAFTYAVSDNRGGSARGRVSITIVPPGTPEAADDLVTTPEDTEVKVDVLANDVPGDQPTAVTRNLPPARGTLLDGRTGSFTYRPSPNDHGDVDFTYTITDADGQRSGGRVRITITPVNDPPTIPTGRSFSTAQDRPLVVDSPELLAGVVDVDGDAVRAVLANGPAHGTVDLRPDGSFTYTPERGFAGSDSFTYRASDGTETSAEAVVATSVTAVLGATENRPPAGGADSSPTGPGRPPGEAAPLAAPSPPSSVPEAADTLRAVSFATGAPSGPPGVALDVSGSGYGGCDTVFFFFDDVRIGAATPDPGGEVRLTGLSVPGDAGTARHIVVSSCSPSGRPTSATASFDVTGARLHRNAVVTSLHHPDQIPLDLRSLAISALASLSLMLLIAFPSELFNKTLEENYDEIRGWFALLQPVLHAARRWPRSVTTVAFFLAGALLYSALDPRFGLRSSSLTTVLAAIVSLVGVVVVYDLPALAYMRTRYGERGRLQVLPGTLVVALPCVVLSRLVGFQPGYLYGLFAFFVFRRKLNEETEGRLYAVQALFLLAAGVVAWIAWASVAGAAGRPGASFGILLVEAILGGLFVAGVESATFALMPFRFLDGHKVVRWNQAAWAGAFGLSAFLFTHILLRPGSGYVGRTADGSTITVEALFFVFAALSVVFWGYFRFRRQPALTPSGDAGSPKA